MTMRTLILGVGMTIVAVAIALPRVGPQASKGPAQQTGGRFMLDVMGSSAGWLLEPPQTSATGTRTPAGALSLILQMGLSMSPNVYDWINASWQSGYSRKNGAIVACNFNYEAMSSREFYNALITEVGFPKLDASDRSRATIKVKLQPERTLVKPRTGMMPRPDPSRQKAWLSSNFRFEMAGLPCSRISRVEAFAVEKGSPSALSFHLNSADAPAWRAATSSSDEKTGALVFLAPNGKDELGRLSFRMTRVRMVQTSQQGPGPDGQARSHVWIAFSNPKLTAAN